MRRAIPSVLVAAAVALVGPASATTVVALELEDLAVQADRAVRGTVQSVESRAADGRVYTYVTVAVERELLEEDRPEGEPHPAPGVKERPQVTLRMLGGAAGELGQYVPGTPSFDEGDDVVLFLRRGRATPEVHHLIGLRQSVYRVRETESGPVAVRELEGVARARTTPAGDTRVEEASTEEAAIPLETLEARVRAARAARTDREIEEPGPERHE